LAGECFTVSTVCAPTNRFPLGLAKWHFCTTNYWKVDTSKNITWRTRLLQSKVHIFAKLKRFIFIYSRVQKVVCVLVSTTLDRHGNKNVLKQSLN